MTRVLVARRRTLVTTVRTLVFAYWLFALLWITAISGCRGGDKSVDQEVSLVGEMATARLSPVVSGQGTLGSCTFRPFLGKGFRPDRVDEWIAPFPGVTEAALGVYLHDVTPLEVTVEGRRRSRGAAKPVSFALDGKVLSSVSVGPQLESHKLRLEAAQLKEGMNWLAIRDCQDTEWLSMKVKPAEGARTLAGAAPTPKGDLAQDTLWLPFDNRIEFALGDGQESWLSFEASPWVEPGAPALEIGSWTLRVAAASEGSSYQTLADVRDEGETRAALEPAKGARALSFRALFTGPNGSPPLPGQLGLKLTRPRLGGKRPETETTPATGTPSPPPPTPGERPNVVVYLVDTLRPDRLSCYGFAKPTSPRLDQMAAESVVFEQAMSTAPWTKPSVASLMTGTEPAVHRVLDFLDKLAPDLVTLAEVFQGAEYQTGAFVANPLVGERFNFNHGFQLFQEVPYKLTSQDVNNKVFPWLDKLKADQPFLLYVHSLDPHIPYNPPAAFRRAWLRGWNQPPKGESSKAILASAEPAAFQSLGIELKRRSFQSDPLPIPQATYDNLNALYEGELANNDAAFGALLDKLKAKGLYDNTIIVFVSDHGEEILERGKLGHLHKVHQELMRIPLVVKFPDGRHGGQRVSEPCQIVDVMPTLLAEAGLPRPAAAQGRLLPLTSSPTVSAPRPFFFDIETGRQGAMARQPEGNYLIDARGIRVGHWTAAISKAGNFPTEPFALFDRRADPGEKKNLWLQHPVTALQLETMMRGYENRRKGSAAVAETSPEETERLLRSLQYLR